MKDRYCLFSAAMARAAVAGTKTQTRRIVKPQPPEDVGRINAGRFHPTIINRRGVEEAGGVIFGAYDETGEWGARCPYGAPGDTLIGQETQTLTGHEPHAMRCTYAADGTAREVALTPDEWELYSARKYPGRTQPGRFMHRSCARIVRPILSIRAERVRDITEEDARAEGVNGGCLICGRESPCGCLTPTPDYRDGFIGLWQETYGAESWDHNDWVWAIEFQGLTGKGR